ncbi:MAG: TrpR-like protein YerC/YecD [Lachnospiraceae bacterium]|nr:TrpR-like protein YerC/YecD [Lachnospiraceae bacterium]
MPRIRNDRNDAIDQLFYGILSLQDLDECYRFFGDLFTVQELSAFAQRLQVAHMLSDGKTYEAIRSEISTSSSTITRVNTELRYGSGGYQLVLDRLYPKKTDSE